MVLGLLSMENTKENVKKSLVCWYCKTAHQGWYDEHHCWWHFLFLHMKYLDQRLRWILPYHKWFYLYSWCHWYQWVNPSSSHYKEVQATCQCSPSPWDWMCVHSIAHKVLPQNRCKPVFPNVQTFAGKQDLKQQPKQHSGHYYLWQYHPSLPN